MMKKFWAALPLAALAGCNTLEELRARPISWTAVYPVRFDVMANCLAVHMVEDAGTGLYTVTPQLHQADRRAVLTGAAGQRLDAEYSPSTTGPTQLSPGPERTQRLPLGRSSVALPQPIDFCNDRKIQS